ncbi:MAG: 1,4-alpha-glucan branching protein GlgB [Gemmataceae bacterium]|nr:1,4-alpha-glucan branching protein GlgB [Gemmataceae bacterium]
MAENNTWVPPELNPLGEVDLHLFNEGTHSRLYEKLGAHAFQRGQEKGTHFSVWAPGAQQISVVGDFNAWTPGCHPLHAQGKSGIWAGFVANLGPGALYKYHVETDQGGYRVDKSDPFAFAMELAPKTASKIASLDYSWHDAEWMRERGRKIAQDAPVAIYEVHLGSWRRDPANPSRLLSCQEIALPLAEHASRLGFTHVELLPITEHPFYASWGYQVGNYFAPTSRYGSPQDLMHLIDVLHQHGLGVILDWVPSHFPNDQHGLSYFDGTHLFEHADPRQGFHPDWKSCIFNYGRHEVRSFLISSACFWLEKYHFDGLRVDAVASMIYLDYSRHDGEWIPNPHGGNENLEATGFLRQFNAEVYRRFPDVQTIAEESTAWPMVSRPVHLGGLGFGYKWDLGWMHDSLRYLAREPVHRKFHQNELSFRMLYAGQENFVLPLSHDEVVHGKGSLAGKMPGDAWQKLANLRLLFAWQAAQPGKKLLFMSGEIAQWNEWNHDASLDWHLAQHAPHGGIINLIADLNRMYRSEPAMHKRDCDVTGLEWVDCSDSEASVYAFLRWGNEGEKPVLAVFNFTPVARHGYRVGVPFSETWKELLNTDSTWYGGGGIGNQGAKVAGEMSWHNRPFSLELSLPPLAAIFFTPH